MFPRRLAEGTADEVRALIGTPESSDFELKRELPFDSSKGPDPWASRQNRAGRQPSTCRALCDTRTTLQANPLGCEVLPACFARIAPALFIVRCGRSATDKATIREHAQRSSGGDHEHEPLVRSSPAVLLTGLSA